MSSVKAARAGIKNLHADVKMDKFNAEQAKVKNTLDSYKQNLEAKINSATNAKEKVAYELQKKWVTKYSAKLETAVKRSDWKELNKLTKEMNSELKPYKWYNRGSAQYEINGQTFTKAELQSLMKDFRSTIDSNIKGIAQLKSETMAGVARSQKYASDVTDYGFSTKWYSTPLNWGYKKYDKGITKGDIVTGAMTLSAPVYALQPALNNPYMTANNIAILADPSYEKHQGDIMAADQVAAQDQQFAQAKANIDTQIENIDKQIKSLA